MPKRYALGIAAALTGDDKPAPLSLDEMWKDARPDPDEKEAVMRLVEEARARLQNWVKSGFPDLEPE